MMIIKLIIELISSQIYRLAIFWPRIIQRLRSKHSSGPKLIEAPQELVTDENDRIINEVPKFSSFTPTRTISKEDDEGEYENEEVLFNDYFEEGFVGFDGFPWSIDDLLLSAFKDIQFPFLQETIGNSYFRNPVSEIKIGSFQLRHLWVMFISFIVSLFIRRIYTYTYPQDNIAFKINYAVKIQVENTQNTSDGSIVEGDESQGTIFESFGPSVSRVMYEGEVSSQVDENDDYLMSLKVNEHLAKVTEDYTNNSNHLDDSISSISVHSTYDVNFRSNSYSSTGSPLNLTFLSDEIANSFVEDTHDSVGQDVVPDLFETLRQFDGLPLISESRKLNMELDESREHEMISQVYENYKAFGEEINEDANEVFNGEGKEGDRVEITVKVDKNVLENDEGLDDTSDDRGYIIKCKAPDEYSTDASQGGAEPADECKMVGELHFMSEFLDNFVPESSSLDEKIVYFENVSRQSDEHSASSSSDHEPHTPGTDASAGIQLIDEEKSIKSVFGNILKPIEIPNHQFREKLPRKQSILKHVFEPSPASKKLQSFSPGSKIPKLMNETSPVRKIYSPRPKSHKEQPFNISDLVLIFLLNPTEPNIDGYLADLFDEDPHVVINLKLLESLSKENIDTMLKGFEGGETFENWKERYETFDLLIGHLRYHEPQHLYSYFMTKLKEVLEDILGMLSTKRSKLLEKVILFTREMIYYGENFIVDDEVFIKSIHHLIPLTKSTSKFIHKLSLKSLCLMVQAVHIEGFITCFDPMFSEIFLNKRLKMEKFACLFMIKFYIAANFNKFDIDDMEVVTKLILPFVPSLAIDSYQKTRSEILEIYLIIQKKIPRSYSLVFFYENLSTFLKSKVRKPEYETSREQKSNITV